MKKSKVLMAILVVALVLAGCNVPTQAPPEVQEDSWQKVQQAGVLRVGTSADYPPFEYYNENSELDGFDIALIRKIGEKLGLKVELNDFAFDDLPSTVAGGQVDVAIGALSVTPEREAIANFSNVYYVGSDAVLSRPEAEPEYIQDTEMLAAARVGVQVDSIYETYAQDRLIDAGLMPKQNLFVYIDVAQAVNDLKTKHIDAVWLDLNPAQRFAAEGGVKVLVQELNQQLYAIGLMKGADSLRDKINEALTLLQNDGTLASLQVQYLGIDAEDVVVPPTPVPTPKQSTPQPTQPRPGCLDQAEWVKDLSYDDKDHKNPPKLAPGEPFTKGWRMRNIGSCTWKTTYKLVYSSGNVPAAQMGGQPIPVTKDVKNGETFDFQVNLIAPIKPGRYQGYWNLRNAQNKKVGETIWVDIVVEATATPTPPPTQTPEPNIYFEANNNVITEGDEVLFEWKTQDARFVYFYNDGQKWSEHLVNNNDKVYVYPPYSMNYYLHVDQNSGAVIERRIWITVNPAPKNVPEIESLSASPSEIRLGDCVGIDWVVKKEGVEQVTLLVNDVAVWENAPLKGNYPDCPVAAGTQTYTLKASGPGGTAKQKAFVTVLAQEPTEEPDEPTETPEPPVVQEPVIDDFRVSPTTIEQGQMVTVSWTTSGGTTRVELLRNDEAIWSDTQLNNSQADTPPQGAPSTVVYTLNAYNNADQVETRSVEVQIAQAPPQNPLAGTTWQLQAMQGPGAVPGEVTITAYFGGNGGLSGNGGCNSYSASYSAEGNSIAIRNPSSEMAACGEPADSLEKAYLELLPQAANFEIRDGLLIVLGNTGAEILRFLPLG